MKKAESSLTVVLLTCREAASCGGFQLPNGFLSDYKCRLCKLTKHASGAGPGQVQHQGSARGCAALPLLTGTPSSLTTNTKVNLEQLQRQHLAIAEQNGWRQEECHSGTAQAWWAPLEPPRDLAWSIRSRVMICGDGLLQDCFIFPIRALFLLSSQLK